MVTAPLTDKQQAALAALLRAGGDRRGVTPTEIGQLCGQPYDTASGWAVAKLRPLERRGLVACNRGHWTIKDRDAAQALAGGGAFD